METRFLTWNYSILFYNCIVNFSASIIFLSTSIIANRLAVLLINNVVSKIVSRVVEEDIQIFRNF